MRNGWITWNGNKVAKAMVSANAKAAAMALEEVGRHADQQIPLRTGAAKDSKHVSSVQDIQKSGVGSISYGGGPGTGHPQVPYVAAIHEIPMNFQRGRKSNFLRDPFNSRAQRAYNNALKQTAKQEGF